MADPRAFLTLILLLFIFFSPNPGPDPLQRTPSRYEAALNSTRANLASLNLTHYGDFDPSHDKWLNITGCESDSEFAWYALPGVKERARQLSAYALGQENVGLIDGEGISDARVPLYRNVTGVLHGGWVRSPVQGSVKEAPRLNMSDFAPEGPFGPVALSGFGRNLTGEEGSVKVWLQERDLARDAGFKVDREGKEVLAVREISAQVTVQDDESMGDGWEAQMYGVHFLGSGNVVLATTSDKFAGIFALPHMTMSEYGYELSQDLLNRTLGKTVLRQEDGEIHSLNPWASDAGETNNGNAPPSCDMIVYLQQHPVPIAPGGTAAEQSSLLDFIEQELRFPTGASGLPSPIGTHFSLLAFSPDCGYVFESKGPPDYAAQEGDHLRGLKTEVALIRARQHLLVFAGVVIAQLFLLKRQMQDASTPSTRSRISFYAISILAWSDGFTFGSFCMASLFIPSLWVPLIATAFFAFMSVGFFGMRFLMEIWLVQAPERERRERERREANIAARAAQRATFEAFVAARAARTAAATAANSIHPVNPTPATGTPATDNPTTNAPATDTPTVDTPVVDTTTTPIPLASVPPLQAPVITLAGADTLPIPVTARRPLDTGATPVFMPSDQGDLEPITQPGTTTTTNDPPTDQDRAAGFGATYTRFYLLLLGTMFLSLNATSWPPSPRRFYFTLLALLSLSMWLPQIHRNAIRNCRRALRRDFVLGQSLLRLLPFAYFYGYGPNVLFAAVDLRDLAVLAVWVWIQVLVLASQEVLGPRWFVRGAWVPPAYDYHPLLREDEEGGGNMPVGATSSQPPTKSAAGGEGLVDRENSSSSNSRTFDCAICMQEFEVPVLGTDAQSDGVGGSAELMFKRRAYMVTPCRHIFHAGCLEGWMKYRLQCPVCREQLPPM